MPELKPFRRVASGQDIHEFLSLRADSLTPTPVDFNNYCSPQYRGQSGICVNIDITDENNYPPLLYVSSRYILVRSFLKMVLSEGSVVTLVV